MKRELVALTMTMVLLLTLSSCTPGATSSPTPQATSKPAAATAAPATTPASQATSKPAAASPTSAAAKASPKSTQKVKMALTNSGTSFLPAFLAKEKGIFQEEGLDVELAVIQGNLHMPSLISGDLDFVPNMPGLLQATIKGEPVKVVMVPRTSNSWRIVLAQGLTSPQQIKGKPVAVGSMVGANQYATEQGLRSLGIDPSKDVTFIAINAFTDQIASLRSGAVGAAALSVPYNTMAAAAGLKEILNTSDVVQTVTTGIGVTEKKIRENPGQVKAFIRAYLRSLAYMRDHPDESIQFTMKQFTLEKELAESAVSDLIRDTSYDGTISDKALPVLLDLVKSGETDAKVKAATQEQMKNGFDFTLLKEAQKELGLSR